MKRAVTWSNLSRSLSIATAVISVSLPLGCSRRSPNLHYVIPNDFRGAFIIYTRRPDGVVLPRSVSGGVETFTCSIPTNGILFVEGDRPFYGGYQLSASFADGRSIPIASNGDELPAGTVALWGGGSRTGGMLYDFVGTTTEAQRFFRETASDEVKVGGVRTPEK
jgi:hypothetical protein